MDFSYQKLNSDNIKMVENKQLVVDCRVSELVDENVSKILCLDASCKVDSFEQLSSEVFVKGKVNYRLIYEDNVGEVRSLNYLCDYEDNILSSNLLSTDTILVTSEVKSTSSSGLDIIRLQAVLGLKIFKVDRKEYDTLCNDNEECYYKMQDVTKNEFVTSVSSSFNLEDEEDTKAVIQDILMLDSSVNLTDTICGENKVTLKGESEVKVTFKQDNKLKTKTFNIPFNEEIEGACSEDSVCYTKLFVDSSKVVLADEDKVLKVKLIVSSNSVIFKPVTVSVVSDMYSMTNDVIVSKEKAVLDSDIGYKNYTDNISIEATLKQALDGKIIDIICPKNKVASVKDNNGEMLVEGVLSAFLLYEKDDKISSICVEAPYSSKLSDFEGEVISINGFVSGVMARLKTDNSIVIDATLKFTVEKKENSAVEVVVSCEDNGEIKQKNCAISIIVIDKPQSFFDVAKRLATTPEELESQNPNLAEPLTTGDKLFFYRKLNKKYEAE